ncbi:MAG: DUF72 domain-containing protein [Thermoplasmatota archaeon]
MHLVLAHAVDVRFGMAAWKYDHLRDVLYPGIPKADWLQAYGRVYDHVEPNVLWRQWPSDAPLARWQDETPASFRFIPKLYRFLTHGQGDDLGTAEQWWEALAPIHDRIPGALVQFPPSFARSPTAEARIEALVGGLGCPAFVEVRHPSWYGFDLTDLGAVPVWRIDDDLPTHWPAHPDVGVVRFRGSGLEQMGTLVRDRGDLLAAVADKVREQSWKTCYVVMTNHFEGSGPLSIERLAHRLGVPAPDRAKAGRPGGQAGLF